MPRFCTARLDDGQPCGYRALPGKPFCSGHSPDNSHLYHRCQYFNRRGFPCRATPLRGQDHCFTHSSRNRRAKDSPVPLEPRTRRQKERARWFILSNLPLSQTTRSQATGNQQLAAVPLYPGAGSPLQKSNYSSLENA